MKKINNPTTFYKGNYLYYLRLTTKIGSFSTGYKGIRHPTWELEFSESTKKSGSLKSYFLLYLGNCIDSSLKLTVFLVLMFTISGQLRLKYAKYVPRNLPNAELSNVWSRTVLTDTTKVLYYIGCSPLPTGWDMGVGKHHFRLRNIYQVDDINNYCPGPRVFHLSRYC